MLHLRDRSVFFAHTWHLARQLGSVTVPQLMRLVNDLNKRVYRMQFLASPTCVANVPVDSSVKAVTRSINGSSSGSVAFGDLADRGRSSG